MAGDGTNEEETYKAAVRELGKALTGLKRERGAPSFDRIRARGTKLLGARSALSKSAMSDIFAGRRGPASLDRLLWLVRTLLAYDDGEEVASPERGDPRLQQWRERWNTLEARRRAARQRPDERVDEAPPAEPEPQPLELRDAQGASSATDSGTDNLLHDTGDVGGEDRRPKQRETSSGQPNHEPLAASPQRRSPPPPTSRFAVGQPLIGQTERVTAVAFSPAGRLLATASYETAQLWDTQTRQAIGDPLTAHDEVTALAFSPDGHLLATASADRTVRLWNTQTRRLDGEPLTALDGVTAVAFSPDGDLLATASNEDETVRLWYVPFRWMKGELTGHAAKVNAVAFSPVGRLLATASDDGTVLLWDPNLSRPGGPVRPIGEPIVGHISREWAGSGLGIHTVAFSPDGALLATTGEDGTVRLWDPQTRRLVGEPLAAKDASLKKVAFSPDSTLLATGDDDGVIQFWDLVSRHPVGEPLTRHDHRVTAVAFSPDGHLLATVGGGEKVIIWSETV
ncbi:WD40 repeat domain-containing protein [Streptomyces paradoxus]|uniref:WD40 repeat domain-containing protein n=1 Tax=Streptomyces paradoxus TaxID=66375 RepID=UPI0036FF825D